MADVVKSILGRSNLQPIDLLDLPIVDESFCFRGFYLDVVLKNGTYLVEGVYVGSSLGYKGYLGISGCVAFHQRFSLRNYKYLPRDVKCHHYSVACKDYVTPHFRIVSLFEVIRGNALATILAEQVLMIYLSTVARAYPNQLNLFNESRNGIQDLPDFSDIGLNRALPLAQNQHWLPCNRIIYQGWLNGKNQEDQVLNVAAHSPICQMKRDGKAFSKRDVALPVGSVDISTRRTAPISLLTQGCTRSWVGWGNPDVYLHLRTHGSDNNSPKYGQTAAGHRKWVEKGHDDVYGTCRVPSPIDSHLVGGKGWKAASKCPACARKPTKKEDEEWMELYGDISAICGVDREYTISIMRRTEKRACALLQTRKKRDKTSDEVDEGASQD
ncbi:uncharacterized protein FPRO_04386 [Fusarium proliferatum ET1]|uniref:Uncharacterized protein n=1 Tax=Fusarium proliferatum (strain ET1) TaxID=1227346 RepID=A0A1L7VFQ3_FUSPR|nr:uncharacterized protein FPRO_04386 [Fusarium proliferatum ET1]CZR39489.1 uncharacterized protein FPRO_04386 [Fusarium proliferatum ET1]